MGRWIRDRGPATGGRERDDAESDDGRDGYDVVVRPMRESDLDRVLQIEYVAFTMPWSSLTYRNLLQRNDAALYVADSPEDGVVGYAAMWSVLDEGELGTLATDPRRRSRGVASRLLERVLERARTQHLKAVFLEVRVSNEDARRLYERFGFERVGLRRNYYAFPLEDAIVMRKPVDVRRA